VRHRGSHIFQTQTAVSSSVRISEMSVSTGYIQCAASLNCISGFLKNVTVNSTQFLCTCLSFVGRTDSTVQRHMTTQRDLARYFHKRTHCPAFCVQVYGHYARYVGTCMYVQKSYLYIFLVFQLLSNTS
jgi:hypothetical protein